MTVKRAARLILLAVAIAGIAATAYVHAGGAATRATGIAVATKFPASGQLAVNSVVVRRHPAPNATPIKTFKYFRSDYRLMEILAVGTAIGTDGKTWYHVSVPMRPNGTYGWIPADAADLSPTDVQIVIDVSARTIDVFKRGKHPVHGRVAVGAPGMETPLGHYYVAAAFVPHNEPFLGVWALETTAYSKLTDWPGGGVVGIHGTDQPWLLGKAISHGCVRVANSTASALKRLAPPGTPIFIKA